jgi:hypothetical protein
VALALDGDPATAPQISMRSGVAERAVRTACAQLERAGVAERTGAGRALLREGADVCVGRAARGVACGLWGECLVSRAWLARLEVGRGEAVERLPASAFPSRGEA